MQGKRLMIISGLCVCLLGAEEKPTQLPDKEMLEMRNLKLQVVMMEKEKVEAEKRAMQLQFGINSANEKLVVRFNQLKEQYEKKGFQLGDEGQLSPIKKEVKK